MQWADEFAWIACTLEYPDCNFVTIGMDKVKFLKSAKEGTILEFVVNNINKGNTTLTYLVNVCRLRSDVEHDLIFSSEVTFIRIDENGQKMGLPQ